MSDVRVSPNHTYPLHTSLHKPTSDKNESWKLETKSRTFTDFFNCKTFVWGLCSGSDVSTPNFTRNCKLSIRDILFSTRFFVLKSFKHLIDIFPKSRDKSKNLSRHTCWVKLIYVIWGLENFFRISVQLVFLCPTEKEMLVAQEWTAL